MTMPTPIWHLLIRLLAITLCAASSGDAIQGDATTGARTGSNDLADSLNVKAYGAAGDGTVDDTVAAQKCIDAAHASGTGSCYFPSGVYIVSRLKLWNGSEPYSGLTISGAGRDLTVLRTRPGTTPSNDSPLNTLELSDPADTSGKSPSRDVTIVDLTLDGNKSNVDRPIDGPANDMSHSGIFSQQSTRLTVRDVTAKNYWYCGASFGLHLNDSTIDMRTENNGYSIQAGYGGILIAGTSQHNQVHEVSDGDIIGGWALNNVRFNTWTGTFGSCISFCFVLNDVKAQSSSGNRITVTIESSRGNGVLIGSVGATTDNTVLITASSILGRAVIIGKGQLGNVVTYNGRIVKSSGHRL